MLNYLSVLWRAVAFNIVVGLVIFQLGSKLFPFRSFDPKDRNREIGWDLIALPLSITFFYLYHLLVEPLYVGVMRDDRLPLAGFFAWANTWPQAAKIVFVILAADFGAYWTHRSMHTRYLWTVHVHHHSPKHLYWLSGLRSSWLNLFIISMPYSFLVLGCGMSTSGTVDIMYLLQQYWVHSNVRVPIGPLRWLIITPEYHFVHHAKDGYADINFGSVFTIWDRMFGTFVDPAKVPKDIELGLDQPVRLGLSVFGLPAMAPVRTESDTHPA